MVWSVLSQAVPVGGYIAWWKAIPVVLLLLAWGRLVTWIDKDSVEVLLPRIPLNVANLAGGVLAFFLFFALPGFFVAFLVACLIVAIEAGVYLTMRNSKVGLGDLSVQFNDWLDSWKGGEKKVKVIQGEVQLIGKNGSLMAAPATDDPILPAYETVQTLLTDPLRRNAERIDLAPADGASVIKYVVDGVAYAGNPVERTRAGAAISVAFSARRPRGSGSGCSFGGSSNGPPTAAAFSRTKRAMSRNGTEVGQMRSFSASTSSLT